MHSLAHAQIRCVIAVKASQGTKSHCMAELDARAERLLHYLPQGVGERQHQRGI